MEKSKQIYDLAIVFEDGRTCLDNDCEVCSKKNRCEGYGIATTVVEEQGYVNQKEVAKEILDEVSKHYGGAWLVDLYKKYGVEID